MSLNLDLKVCSCNGYSTKVVYDAGELTSNLQLPVLLDDRRYKKEPNMIMHHSLPAGALSCDVDKYTMSFPSNHTFW